MNPYYQYAIREGYLSADATITSIRDTNPLSSSQEEAILQDAISETYAEPPIMEEASPIIEPIRDETPPPIPPSSATEIDALIANEPIRDETTTISEIDASIDPIRDEPTAPIADLIDASIEPIRDEPTIDPRPNVGTTTNISEIDASIEPIRDELTTTTTPILDLVDASIKPSKDEATIDPIIESRPNVAAESTTSGKEVGTTINIYSPDTVSSTTSVLDEITLDGNVIPSLGGGGGMFSIGKGKGKGKGARASKKAVTTRLPLALLAAGIAVLILKPYK